MSLEITQEMADKLKEMADEFQPTADLAQELCAKDPKLSPISAIIIAGDIRSQRVADTIIAEGGTFDEALTMVGSFARLDWAVKNRHLTTNEHLYEILPSLWSGSDPDDSDLRFFELWNEAWIANGKKTIIDGKPLPENKRKFTIYRGQDDNNGAGLSWSLDQSVAEKFARGAGTRQFDRNGIVYIARVRAKNIIAYLTNRNEEEIIVNPFSLEEY